MVRPPARIQLSAEEESTLRGVNPKSETAS